MLTTKQMPKEPNQRCHLSTNSVQLGLRNQWGEEIGTQFSFCCYVEHLESQQED